MAAVVLCSKESIAAKTSHNNNSGVKKESLDNIKEDLRIVGVNFEDVLGRKKYGGRRLLKQRSPYPKGSSATKK